MSAGVLSPNMTIGPYTIRQAMARGGMATVYYAALKDGSSEVALKISRFAETDRRYGNALRFEADLLEKLNHPNIVNIEAIPLPGAKIPPFSAKALQIKGHPWYYTMEFLHGNSLLSYVQKGGTLPVDIAISIAYQVSRGLLFLHKHGYAHLDIKAENILFKYPLTKGELIHPVIIDFGVSAQTSRGLESTGGTLLIMSPERLSSGSEEQDHDAGKMDVYSIGVTLYRILTGQYPFAGFSQRALISSILNDIPKPPDAIRKGIPEEVNTLVMNCLEKEQVNRPSLPHLVAFLERLPYRISRLNRDI